MDNDAEIFTGKTFSSLAKDIYFNSTRKAQQIDQLIKDLRTMIKDAGSATVIAPMIKDYLDVSVKNDDQLIKLSAVLQRAINNSPTNEESAGGGYGLSEFEKEELLNSVKSELKDVSDVDKKIQSEMNNLDKQDKLDGLHKNSS
jgi:Rad3-related DNA helicase